MHFTVLWFCRTSAALLLIATSVLCMSLPLEQAERFISTTIANDAPRLSSSLLESHFSPGSTSSVDHFSPERSWSEILRSQGPVPPFFTHVETPTLAAYNELEQSMDGLQQRLREDAEIWSRNGLREFSQEERLRSLVEVGTDIRAAMGQKRFDKNPIIRPFTGQISKEVFESYLTELFLLRGRLGHKLGMWQYSVGGKHFLLNQANFFSPIFEEANGFVHRNSNKILFAVWQEVGTRDPDIYQYVGVFQAPDHRRVRKFRNEVLEATARKLIGFRALSSSTFVAEFSAHP